MKRISILGATGSVGCQSLDVIAQHPDQFEIIALTAHDNADKLIEQALQFRPQTVAIAAPHYQYVKSALVKSNITVMAGDDGIIEAATLPADLTVGAIMGAAGLKPIWAAIESGADIALANKEALVCAGHLLTGLAKKHQKKLLPLDSEHNAIFQALQGHARADVIRFILTASGGAFRDTPIDQLKNVMVEDALQHPTWSMGRKITIDSATMVNKGLELIEACHLFDADEKEIDVVIHPQSIVHSMVEFKDGSVLAQMGASDMRVPVAYCLGWPQRLAANTNRLDWRQSIAMQFMPPDNDKFPALELARSASRQGGHACIVLNAANEIAVQAFLDRRIQFLNIVQIVQKMLETLDFTSNASLSCLDDVLELDQLTRAKTEERIKALT